MGYRIEKLNRSRRLACPLLCLNAWPTTCMIPLNFITPQAFKKPREERADVTRLRQGPVANKPFDLPPLRRQVTF